MSSKITLSAKEFELVTNAEWFFTKRIITDKVYRMFASVAERVTPAFKEIGLPGQKITKPAKIFKGENYNGLPWVMLDYPREFSSNDIFAIRTMFWWANYFSVTLHLRGIHMQQLINNGSFELPMLQHQNFFICINAEEWQHEFEKPNYVPAGELSAEDFNMLIKQKQFFKIGKKFPLTEWDNAVDLIVSVYDEMTGLFKS